MNNYITIRYDGADANLRGCEVKISLGQSFDGYVYESAIPEIIDGIPNFDSMSSLHDDVFSIMTLTSTPSGDKIVLNHWHVVPEFDKK